MKIETLTADDLQAGRAGLYDKIILMVSLRKRFEIDRRLLDIYNG